MEAEYCEDIQKIGNYKEGVSSRNIKKILGAYFEDM